MGKMAMVIVLGLTLASVFLGYTMSHSNTASVGNMSTYFKYTMARNIAHTAVNISLHQLEKGNDSTMTFSGTAMSGTYTVNIVYTGDTLDMSSQGRYVDTTYTMRLRLWRYPKPFPDAKAPVNISLDSVNYTMDGSTSIDGRNYDISGNLLPDSVARPAVAALTTADSTTVAAYGTRLVGTPLVMTDPNMSNPGNYVNEYIANADYNYTPEVYGSNMTWGSATDPKIVYCNAGTSDRVKFTGGIQGWGILVVRGNLELAGNFAFAGLVIVYQNGTIDDTFSMSTGTPRIIGAVFVAGGNGSSFNMKGNGKVVYSSDALNIASHMKKLQAYRILSWYE